MGFKFDWEANEEKIIDFKLFIRENRYVRGGLMSMLQEGQRIFGYLPIEVQQIISDETNIPLSEIYGVVTFYSQFSLIPKGKYDIGLCLGTACYVRGAQKILDEAKKQLGIDVGGTTSDLMFTMSATRCIGACGLAPVMMIEGDVYAKLKPSDLFDIFEKYRKAGSTAKKVEKVSAESEEVK